MTGTTAATMPAVPIGIKLRIRYRQAEITAVAEHKARCFVVTRGDLSSADMAQRFITNKAAILMAAAEPGPYIYSVRTDRISRLYP